MIAAGLLGLAGIVLLAAGTPRQADLLLKRRSVRSFRRRLRLTGTIVLGASLALVLGGADRARQFLAWAGLIGMEALAVALLFTLLAQWSANLHRRER